ncbi:MAG: hypothetical protein ABW044_01150 [Cellvibrio sp.]
MFTFIRQSPHKLQLWLVATAAVLLLASILEAGHAHGTFTAPDDNCALCQHPVALDKVLAGATMLFIALLLVACVGNPTTAFISSVNINPTQIRAPPTQLHSH